MTRFLLARPAAALVAAAALFAAAPSRAAEPPLPAPPQSWVTDAVGYMSPGARQSLSQRLEAYERQTGHQILVWIGATTGGVPIEDFAVKAFEKWKVGRAAKDDGLVFFLFTEDRKMRIEVGYGLEDKVTDFQADRIIREVVAPRLQANDPDGAITAGAAAILSTIDGTGGETSGETATGVGPEAPPRGVPRPLTAAQKVMIAVIGIGLLVLLITNPSLAVWLLLNMLSGGGGGRGGGYSGGGGGGWSGGGGRSGGGGASGSW